jgi:hypothetical protein
VVEQNNITETCNRTKQQKHVIEQTTALKHTIEKITTTETCNKTKQHH